jgi:hypothetical protein
VKKFVARQAARERSETAGQIETPDYLGGLMPAIGLSHPVPMGHDGMFEQAAVPRQKDSLLLHGSPNQFWIVGAVAVRGIEPKHAQVSCEPAELDIEHKPGLAKSLQTEAQLRRDIEGFKYRIYSDPVSIPNHAGEVRGFTVDDHQIDFRVGHAETLDHVFHGPWHEEVPWNSSVLLIGRQMIVELGVEAK